MARLRDNRDFQFLWWGRTLSLLGDNVVWVVLPLAVLSQPGGTPAWAGVITSAMALAGVLARIPAGLLSDRWDSRRIMLMCDTGCLAAMAALAGLVRTHAAPVLLLGPAIVLATLSSLFAPAAVTAITRLVPAERLPSVLALSEGRGAVLALVGFPLGGTLYALARWAPFLLDAVSYAGSVLVVLLIRRPLRSAGEQRARFRAPALLDGLRFLRRDRVLLAVAAHAAVINTVFGGLTLATAVVVAGRAGSSAGPTNGLVMVLASSGTLVGASAAAWCGRRLSIRATVLLVSGTAGVLVSLMAFTTAPLAIGLLLGVCCAVVPLETVTVSTYQLRVTPDHMIGRVSAAVGFVAMSMAPVGPLATGALLDAVGRRATLGLLGGTLCAAAVAVVVLFPRTAVSEHPGRASPTRAHTPAA